MQVEKENNGSKSAPHPKKQFFSQIRPTKKQQSNKAPRKVGRRTRNSRKIHANSRTNRQLYAKYAKPMNKSPEQKRSVVGAQNGAGPQARHTEQRPKSTPSSTPSDIPSGASNSAQKAHQTAHRAALQGALRQRARATIIQNPTKTGVSSRVFTHYLPFLHSFPLFLPGTAAEQDNNPCKATK